MNCINFSVKTKNYKKYLYCRFQKKEISFEDCRNCEFKQYKEIKKIKGKKHKQTKKTDIPKKVKIAVWNRDNYRCIFCNEQVEWNYANAHFIPRSAGGLGIEENIFTACENCHREQDNGLHTKEYTLEAEEYLKSFYGSNWTKDKLVYKKY